MRVKSAYPLKTFPSLEEAQKYYRKIKGGTSKHSDCELEIHYNPKARKQASLASPKSQLVQIMQGAPEENEEEEDQGHKWSVVVVNSEKIPGGSTCAECEATHFADDYLCPDCREMT